MSSRDVMTIAEHLIRGFTQSELAKMFNMSGTEIRERLNEVPDNGTRRGVKVYRMRDAAPKLVKMTEDADMVERILRMKHTDLPKMLSKEYWQGQLNKQKYERERGDLWETTKIIEHVGGAYKTLRLSLQLMMDAVERETRLSELQRGIIQELIDSTLDDMRESLQNVRVENKREPTSYEATSSEEDDRYADL